MAMTPRETLHAIAAEFGITYDELVGPRRPARIVAVRAIAVARLRADGMLLKDIARSLGYRDHTGVWSLLRGGKRKPPRRTPCRATDHLCKDTEAA